MGTRGRKRVNRIDRYLLCTFLKLALVSFVCLTALYIVGDAMERLDDFMQGTRATGRSLGELVGWYYGYRLVYIFDRLSGMVVVIAVTFTIAGLQRHNELAPLLSAGVPLRRIGRPLAVGAVLVLGLSVANREWLMPRFALELENPASDPLGERFTMANSGYDPNGIVLAAEYAHLKGQRVQNLICTISPGITDELTEIEAREAFYVPPGAEPISGGWLLVGTTPLEIASADDQVLRVLEPGRMFVRTAHVDFARLTRCPRWYQYASSRTILEELRRPLTTQLLPMAVHLHSRWTMPILTLLLAWIGAAFLLRDHAHSRLRSAGVALAIVILSHLLTAWCRELGEQGHVGPVLAAWLPVLIVGPAGVALAGGVRT